jgi:hypothetical protein
MGGRARISLGSLVDQDAVVGRGPVGRQAWFVARRRRHASLRTLVVGVLFALALLFLLGITPGRAAESNDRQQMQGLDEQVQEIKSDVLGIAAELGRLEEKLLYPSNTQVAVFVALAPQDQSRFDAVRIQIDGQLVAHYIYSFKELDALRRGGVQRLYVGNVTTGAHQIDVQVQGKAQGGADFSHTGQFTFTKGVEPTLVGMTLAGPDSGRASIEFGNW